MKKQMRNSSSGITLIALVISIIVMLILAGVSINAVVGDNGILSQAQDAVYMQSIAALQEFLQMEYSQYAVEADNYTTPQELLKNKHSEWFFQNIQGYVIDNDGHALYLINKANLPDDIRNQVKGGDARQVTAFYAQRDVYGVTSDLMVYYCKNGTDTIMGLSIEDLDKDNPLAAAYEQDSMMAEIINGGTAPVSYQELKALKKLVIDENRKLDLLKDLKNLPSLQELTLKNITSSNLEGIDKASSLSVLNIQSCNITNYSNIANCRKLTSLYLINTTDDEVTKLMAEGTGLYEKEIPSLLYFGIYGNKTVTDISCIANLGSNTKARIENLYFNNNNLSSIASLSTFTGCKNLDVKNNANLTSLLGINNMANLEYIYASDCNLGDGESAIGPNESTDAIAGLAIKNSLYYVDLQRNPKLKYVKYLADAHKKIDGTYGDITIRSLYLSGCTGILDISTIASVIGNTGRDNNLSNALAKNIINDTIERLDLSGQTLKRDEFAQLANKPNLKYLNISNITLKENDGTTNMSNAEINTLINETLKTCTGMRFLDLDGVSALSSITFVKEEYQNGSILYGMPYLIEIALWGTNVGTQTTDADGNYTGLELLNDNCPYIATIKFNKAGSNLKHIQTALNKFLQRYKYFSSEEDVANVANIVGVSDCKYWSVSYWGLYTTADIAKTAAECEDLKILRTNKVYFNSKTDEFLDLSGCTSLLGADIVEGFLKAKLPSNLIIFWSSGNSGGYTCDFSLCTVLEDINMWCQTSGTQEDFDKIVRDLTPNTELKAIILDRFNINSLKGMSSWRNKNNLTKINIWDDSSRAYGYRDNRCSTQLKSLEGVENLVYVEDLTIGYNQIFSPTTEFDISAISNLTNLKKLKLNDSYIANIEPLRGLTNLETLNLHGNNISDISALSQMQNLTELDLSKNKIASLKALENMKKLEKLNLESNVIYDYGYYRSPEGNIKSCNNITILGDLNLNGHLRNLFLKDNFIEEVSVLNDSSMTWEETNGWERGE